MFTAYREFYRYGRETDDVDMTIKYFDSADKAIAYICRYAKGIRFCHAWVENESEKVIYEICNGGADTYDYRH